MVELWNTEDIRVAIETLRNGGVILYPTDTIWGIGCDAEHTLAVERVFELKGRAQNKSLIVLVTREVMRSAAYCDLELVDRIPSEPGQRPTTVILQDCRNLAPGVCAADGSGAFRFPQDEFCQALISGLGRGLVSSSANLSGVATGGSWADIPEELKASVDYAVHYRREEKIVAAPSRIIKLLPAGGESVIRE